MVTLGPKPVPEFPSSFESCPLGPNLSLSLSPPCVPIHLCPISVSLCLSASSLSVAAVYSLLSLSFCGPVPVSLLVCLCHHLSESLCVSPPHVPTCGPAAGLPSQRGGGGGPPGIIPGPLYLGGSADRRDTNQPRLCLGLSKGHSRATRGRLVQQAFASVHVWVGVQVSLCGVVWLAVCLGIFVSVWACLRLLARSGLSLGGCRLGYKHLSPWVCPSRMPRRHTFVSVAARAPPRGYLQLLHVCVAFQGPSARIII